MPRHQCTTSDHLAADVQCQLNFQHFKSNVERTFMHLHKQEAPAQLRLNPCGSHLGQILQESPARQSLRRFWRFFLLPPCRGCGAAVVQGTGAAG